jgi:uncharacterized protein (TIGR04222 family)
MTLNPFALDGPHFLILYGLLLVATLLLCRVTAERLRPEGRRQSVSDPDSLALLGGGRQRLAEAAVTRLLVAGQLRHAGDDRFVPGPRPAPGASALDHALVTLPMPARWRHLSRAATAEGNRLRHWLEGQGLMIDAEARLQLRLVQTLPLVALLGLGGLRLWQGLAHDKPVGFLVILMILGLLLLLKAFAVDPRSRAGIAAWKLARVDHRRLRLAARDAEAALGVALFGTAVLAGSWLEPLHRLRSSDGGTGAETSGDGSGCGGGGCGGCGS